MNLTVGPLPPAVYWRRRAIVAGGLLVVILLIVYSCSGSGSPGDKGQRQLAAEQSQSPSATVTLPGIDSSASPSDHYGSPSASPNVSPNPSPAVTATGAGGIPACSDIDMKISTTIESTSPTNSTLQYGGTFALKLKIQNVSDHACTRDVGSVAESLTISQGGNKIWSSDDCDGARGAKAHDVRTFQPNVLIYAQVNWNSYFNTAKSCTKGTTPAARGTYQLTGNLGTAISPVTDFTIE